MSDVADYIDILTCAWSRTYFETELTHAVSLAKQRREKLAMLWFDVDNLQELNDLFGREAMDRCLGDVTKLIGETLDGQGPIGRVRGGSFAAFLRHCEYDRAVRLAERVRRAVQQYGFSGDEGEIRITLSAGVALLRFGEPWGNFIEAAESACLKAKQGGRDLVVAR